MINKTKTRLKAFGYFALRFFTLLLAIACISFPIFMYYSRVSDSPSESVEVASFSAQGSVQTSADVVLNYTFTTPELPLRLSGFRYQYQFNGDHFAAPLEVSTLFESLCPFSAAFTVKTFSDYYTFNFVNRVTDLQSRFYYYNDAATSGSSSSLFLTYVVEISHGTVAYLNGFSLGSYHFEYSKPYVIALISTYPVPSGSAYRNMYLFSVYLQPSFAFNNLVSFGVSTEPTSEFDNIGVVFPSFSSKFVYRSFAPGDVQQFFIISPYQVLASSGSNTSKSSDYTYFFNNSATEKANYDLGYSDGFSAGENSGYDNGYSAGQSTGYDNGYKIGNSDGYNTGFSAGVASANNYTFLGLMGAVFDAPIKAITGLLSFDVLGFNMRAFVLSLFTLCIVVKLIQVFTGGGA